jgi:hypothetical protein
MTREEEILRHPSFGLVGLSRYHGGNDVMFGSSIKHNSGIGLTISTASHRRDLSRDWYYAEKVLIEVKMSASQFAEMITTPNVGSGVPCTIAWKDGEYVEKPPFISQAETIRDEFQETVSEITKAETLYMKEAMDILDNKPSISKGDRETIKDAISQLIQHFQSNLPFVQTQFHEQMDKTITEAKAEIEAFVETKIRSTGLEAMRSAMPQLGEGTDPN